MENKKTISAVSVKAYTKKGTWYAVISYTDNEGNYKKMWRTTKIKNVKKRKTPEPETKEIIEQLGKKMANEINKELYGYVPSNGNNFFNYLDCWLSKKEANVQPSTYKGYCKYVSSIEKYKQFDKDISEITTRDIEAFYAYLRKKPAYKTKKPLTENTVLHYHTLLKNVFQQAINFGVIEKNPMNLVERPHKKPTPAKTLNKEQVNMVLEKTQNDRMAIVIQLALSFGMRRSEICALSWDDVNFESTKTCPYGSISVNSKAISVYGKEDKKEGVEFVSELKTSSSRRTLPLNEKTRKILLDHKAKQEKWRKEAGKNWNKKYNGRICTDSMGNILSPNYITDHWLVVKKNLELDVTFHDLRHTFATLLLKEGESLKHIQAWLGHSSIMTTGNIYSHISGGDLVGMANKTASIIKMPWLNTQDKA